MSNISAFAHGFVNGIIVIPNLMYNHNDYQEYDLYIYELGVNIAGWTLLGIGSYFVLNGILNPITTTTYHSSGEIDLTRTTPDLNKMILGNCLLAAGAYNVVFNNHFSNDLNNIYMTGYYNNPIDADYQI